MKMNVFFLATLAVIIFQGCKPREEQFQINEGRIFGTTYRVVYQSATDHHQNLKSLLDSINNSLSIHDPNSIISRVNRAEEGVKADRFFSDVFMIGERIFRETGGAFNMSVAPLVLGWGFGPGERMNMTTFKVDSLLQYVGMRHFAIENGYIINSKPGAMLDAGAIAQGYAADVLARYLKSHGVQNWMVEVGGEISTLGLNKSGLAWQIGIEKPIDDTLALKREFELVIGLSGQSLATSGNYRNFYFIDGKKISHTIDPRTGYPVTHSLLSASIIAGDCASADAYATACLVLGRDGCLELLENLPGVEGLLIYHDGDSNQVVYTSGFKQFLQ